MNHSDAMDVSSKEILIFVSVVVFCYVGKFSFASNKEMNSAAMKSQNVTKYLHDYYAMCQNQFFLKSMTRYSLTFFDY